MKTTDSQKGIAHLGLILLIVLVLGVVGFIGWRVYDNNKKDDSQKTGAETKRDTSQKPKEEAKKETPSNLKEYKSEEAGLTFSYPKDWKLEATIPNDPFLLDITIQSPDYERIDEGGVSRMTKGGTFYINVNQTESDEFAHNDGEYTFVGKNGENFLLDYFTYKNTVTIDGVNALRGECGHHTMGQCVYVLHNKKVFGFSYQEPKSKTPANTYLNDYEKLLGSIELN